MEELKETWTKEWLKRLKEDNIKFFVLKIEDFIDALSWKDIELFDSFLAKHEEYRISLGKNPNNKYWVVNRDEPYADEVKKIIEDNEGVAL